MLEQFQVKVLGYNEKKEIVLKFAVPRRYLNFFCRGLRGMDGHAWDQLAEEVEAAVTEWDNELKSTWLQQG